MGTFSCSCEKRRSVEEWTELSWVQKQQKLESSREETVHMLLSLWLPLFLTFYGVFAFVVGFALSSWVERSFHNEYERAIQIMTPHLSNRDMIRVFRCVHPVVSYHLLLVRPTWPLHFPQMLFPLFMAHNHLQIKRNSI